jgi:hypothetical protein
MIPFLKNINSTLKVFRAQVGFAVVLFLAIVMVACNGLNFNNDFSEGYIEYAIEYDESIPFKYDSKLRPTKMVIKFKDGNTINRIEGFSGSLSLAFVQNIETQQNYTLIKVFSKKLFYQEPIKSDTYPLAYASLPKLTITKSNEDVNFLGLKCISAIASSTDSILLQFPILYTNELAISNPNFNSPFEDVEGVMLKFSVTLFNQKMNISATSIKHAKISDDEFTVPKDYEEVDYVTLMDLLELLQ